MAKAPAKKNNTDVGPVIDYSSHEGAGMENATADDYAVPFIKIVQKSSPIIDENPEARPGQMYNSIDGSLFDELILIPCSFKKEFVHWHLRKTDGGVGDGIINTLPMDTPLLAETEPNDKNQNQFPDGHEFEKTVLVDTRYHTVMVIDPGTGAIFPAMMAMVSTQAKRSKRWMSLMSARKVVVQGKRMTAPSYAFQYHATTVKDEKDGDVWYSWQIVNGDQIDDPSLFQECAAFYQASKAGEVRGVDDDTSD